MTADETQEEVIYPTHPDPALEKEYTMDEALTRIKIIIQESKKTNLKNRPHDHTGN